MRLRYLFGVMVAGARILLLVTALAAVVGCAPERPIEPFRHLVLVTAETLRADRIGAYGYAAARTPSLDALARESIRFERAYAQSSMTLPSVVSLLSGLLPVDHRVHDNRDAVPKTLDTLATRLDRAGFATGAFIGNWVLRPSRPLDRGFDRYTQEFRAKESVREKPENLAGPLTDQALAWLDERKPHERIFMWVHYQEPHGPYTPPDFDSAAVAKARPVLRRSVSHSGRGAIPRYQWLGHGRVAEYEARYDGEIAEMDRHLGRLLAGLRERGLLDEGVLVFTADHGEAFGEEGLFCAHGEGLGEVLLRVPLLLRVPGRRPEVRRDVVRLIDVPSTVLEVLGVEPGRQRGESLLRNTGDRDVVAQVAFLGQTWRSLRRDGLELREEKRAGPTLRDGSGILAADAKSEARLTADLERLAPWPQTLPRPVLERSEREALDALGYLE